MSIDPPEDRANASRQDVLADLRPRWWGVTPAVTPRPWWTPWRPRRSDWSTVLQPDHADPAEPWRLAAVWLLAVPLIAAAAGFSLIVSQAVARAGPLYALVRLLEREVGEWAALSPCAVLAAAAGMIWLLRRGRWEPAAKRAAVVYAVGVAWLYLCGATAIFSLGAAF